MHEIGLKKKYLLLDTLLSSLAHMFYAKLLYSYVHQKKKHFSWRWRWHADRAVCSGEGSPNRWELVRFDWLPVKSVRSGSGLDWYQTGPNSKFKKMKILKKFLKILQGATNLMLSNFLKNSFIYYSLRGFEVKQKNVHTKIYKYNVKIVQKRIRGFI